VSSNRRYVIPDRDAAVWCPSGRWGPRRVRVTECWALLTAENVYTALLRDDMAKARPGGRGSVEWTVNARSFSVHWQLRANAVWRFGRVFLICPTCWQLATRIYVPTEHAGAACRRCWGLSYQSRKNNYRISSWLDAAFGSYAETETVLARERRKQASATRYAERRSILTVF